MGKRKDEIVRMLLEGKTFSQIVRAIGCAKSTISYHATKLGMKRCDNEPGFSKFNWKEIQKYYDEGHNIKDCSAKFGVSAGGWNSARLRGMVVGRSRGEKYVSSLDPKRETKKLCPSCEMVHIWLESRTCKSCMRTRQVALTKQTTVAEVKSWLSVSGKHPSYVSATIRAMGKSWNKNLPQDCEKCGYTYHVEQCHIKPIKDFLDSSTLGEINDRNNIKILCRNCHWEFDHQKVLPL